MPKKIEKTKLASAKPTNQKKTKSIKPKIVKSDIIAVIKTGGKQYKVQEGMILNIEKIVADKKTLEFNDILAGKKVTAKILGSEKGDKIRILKFKRKTRYLRRQGHRQNYTKIEIIKIT